MCLPKLRFNWGDRVRAKVGGTEWDWVEGTIVGLRKFGHPYFIQCDNGQMVQAPEDDDCYVRKMDSPDPAPPKDPEAELHEKALFEYTRVSFLSFEEDQDGCLFDS